MKKLLSLLSLCLLAACAKPLEVTTITPIQTANGSGNIDVYADSRSAGEVVPEFTGDQIVDVRSYTSNKNGNKGKEFAGASCVLEARDFTANLVTPAKVRVPLYRDQSSPLTVSCTHKDHHPKLAERAVFNLTKAERLDAGSNAGLAGVLIMAVVNEASDESNDVYNYHNIDVVMRPLKAKTN